MDSSLSARPHVYRAITNRIIEAIEAGAGEFVMPWHQSGPSRGRPTNATTGMPYRGANVVALWAEAMLAGFRSGHWASYRQWQSVGAKVRSGARGAVIVFYKIIERANDEEDQDKRNPSFAQASHVFNADQVDGWSPPEPPLPGLAKEVPEAEAFVKATGADIRCGYAHASYSRKHDRIELPPMRWFLDTKTRSATEAYYATVLHELVHWTGAAHRLDRTFGAAFGDAAYAAEELVAEIGAAFLCADLGLTNEPRKDHAAYIEQWLRILGDDARAIFTAARLATNATNYLHGNIAPGQP